MGAVPPLVGTNAGRNVRLRHTDSERGPKAGSTSGLRIDLAALNREGGMKWRVMVEPGGFEGTEKLYEVIVGGSTTAECPAGTLGLSVAAGKELSKSDMDAAAWELGVGRAQCYRLGVGSRYMFMPPAGLCRIHCINEVAFLYQRRFSRIEASA